MKTQKTKKRLLVVILAVFTALFLCACSKDTGSSDRDNKRDKDKQENTGGISDWLGGKNKETTQNSGQDTAGGKDKETQGTTDGGSQGSSGSSQGSSGSSGSSSGSGTSSSKPKAVEGRTYIQYFEGQSGVNYAKVTIYDTGGWSISLEGITYGGFNYVDYSFEEEARGDYVVGLHYGAGGGDNPEDTFLGVVRVTMTEDVLTLYWQQDDGDEDGVEVFERSR